MQPRAAGTWPSPISAELLVRGAADVGQVVPDGDDVWWAESRPGEGGRVAVVRWQHGDCTEVTPPGSNVRSSVHEYGGGAWWAQDGMLHWVEFADQRLRRMRPGNEPVLLTPEPEVPRGLRFADGRPSPDGRWYVCIRELHDRDGAVTNDIVAVAEDGSFEMRTLVGGADFYATPRVSPDGTRLAWTQWDRPNMPWDSTSVWVADLEDGRATGHRLLVGNGDEAVGHPTWLSDGSLLVATDRTDWWNLWRVDVTDGTIQRVVDGDADVVNPLWVFGGARVLDGVHVERGHTRDQLSDGTPLGSFSEVYGLAGTAGLYTFSGASYGHPSAPVRVRDGVVEVLREPADLGLDATFLPEPEFIQYPTGDDEMAFGLFYAPANPAFTTLAGERPPLVVMVHGGPTAAAGRHLSLDIRFWTSRGFAVVDVDYRGSTGYGRRFRNLLRGRWCEIDVEDAIAAARFLSGRGDVDGDRMVITGGSAGGTTTLLGVMGDTPFAAGANYFGVSDLVALLSDDHKFESRYCVQLIGPYPEAADVYVARSPINRIDEIGAPLIVLQGADDPIVPPHHSTRIVEGLRARGVLVEHREYPGEGHGFRGEAALLDSIRAEHAFYLRVFGLDG
jgi:dipeptidyl aminopeptidase/acylaminoacyl peptidase